MVVEAIALASLGVGVFQATQKKPSGPKYQAPVATPIDDTDPARKTKKYPRVAQLFRDTSPKLGVPGLLGGAI